MLLRCFFVASLLRLRDRSAVLSRKYPGTQYSSTERRFNVRLPFTCLRCNDWSAMLLITSCCYIWRGYIADMHSHLYFFLANKWCNSKEIFCVCCSFLKSLLYWSELAYAQRRFSKLLLFDLGSKFLILSLNLRR